MKEVYVNLLTSENFEGIRNNTCELVRAIYLTRKTEYYINNQYKVQFIFWAKDPFTTIILLVVGPGFCLDRYWEDAMYKWILLPRSALLSRRLLTPILVRPFLDLRWVNNCVCNSVWIKTLSKLNMHYCSLSLVFRAIHTIILTFIIYLQSEYIEKL